jgi:excinuclease UvrABC nuclease subunit
MEVIWNKELVPFGHLKHPENITEKAGVYIVSRYRSSDDKQEVKYVGKAEDLRKRAMQHWSESEENEDLKKCIHARVSIMFYYAEVSVDSDRDGIEAYLFQTFSPSCNTQEPQLEKPIPVNLPEVTKELKNV